MSTQIHLVDMPDRKVSFRRNNAFRLVSSFQNVRATRRFVALNHSYQSKLTVAAAILRTLGEIVMPISLSERELRRRTMTISHLSFV